jgi:hypothetical protein
MSTNYADSSVIVVPPISDTVITVSGDTIAAVNVNPAPTTEVVIEVFGIRTIQGVDGADGANGADGAPGADGADGVDGTAALLALCADTLEPTGWVDPDNITVTYDSSTLKITLSHASGILEYYWRGELKSLASPWTSDAHFPFIISNTRYFLYSSNGTTFFWSSSAWNFNDLMVAVAFYDNGYSEWWAIREVHGLMPWQAHEETHDLLGTYRKSGLGLTAGTYNTNSPVDADNCPGFAAGVIKDEDCLTTIPLTSEGSYTTLRIGAASAVVFDTAATFPFRTSGSSFPLVNNPVVGNETATVTGRYINVYEVLLPACLGTSSQKRRRVLLQPQAAYTSLAAAQAEDFRSLNLGGLSNISPEFVAYTRITYVTSAGDTGATGKCRIATNGISYVVGSRASQVSITTGVIPTAENIYAPATSGLTEGTVASQLLELDTEKQAAQDEVLAIACSDETSALTAGTTKVTFRMPYAFTLTSVRAQVNTAPTGATLIVDINESGVSILSTKLSIDVSEKTSVTAATPAVISDTALADDAEITIDIDQVGSTVAGKGLKVYLLGRRA